MGVGVLDIATPIGDLPARRRLLVLLHAIPSPVLHLLVVLVAKVNLTELEVLDVIPLTHRAVRAVATLLFLTDVLIPDILFPFPPMHLTETADLLFVPTVLGSMGLFSLKWLGREIGMETPTLEAPEPWALLLIHLHPKPTLTFRVLPPVSDSIRTGMARAREQFVYSELQQNAPALLETVKPLLLLMAMITPLIVIPFTPRKAKLRLKPALIVMELLLQAKPATTTPGIGLVGRMAELLPPLLALLLLLVSVAGIT